MVIDVSWKSGAGAYTFKKVLSSLLYEAFKEKFKIGKAFRYITALTLASVTRKFSKKDLIVLNIYIYKSQDCSGLSRLSYFIRITKKLWIPQLIQVWIYLLQTDCIKIIHLNKCAYFTANLLITSLKKINKCIDNKSQRNAFLS